MLALLPASALAAPPANDDFAAAQSISGSSTSATGTNVDATKELGEPDHGGAIGGHSVWYRWVAPFSGTATIEATGTGFNPVVGVYTGSELDDLTRVSTAFGARDVPASARFSAVEGRTYLIAVDGLSGATGPVGLDVNLVPEPPNDDFANAETLTGDSAEASADTTGATREPYEREHRDYYPYRTGAGATVWYSWTAPADGGVTVSTEASPTPSDVAVYTGSSLRGAKRVADTWHPSGRVAFRAAAGTTYKIVVDANSLRQLGEVRLALSFRPVPDNDAFAMATTLPSDASTEVTGRNDGASLEPGEPSSTGFYHVYNSVWYSWTAPKSGSLSVKVAGAGNGISAYTGDSAGALTPVTYQACPCGSGQMRIRVAAGVTYRFAVTNGYDFGGDFTLSLDLVDMPANDDFGAAVQIDGTSVDVDATNVGATQERGEPVHDDNYYDPSVWYSWTAPADGGVTLDFAGSELNAVAGVYTGDSVDKLTRVDVTRSIGTGLVKRRFRAVAGTTYHIAVDGARAAQGRFHLALRTVAPPDNDMFVNAVELTGSDATASGNNIGATREVGESRGRGASVWYVWTAPSSGAVRVKLAPCDFSAGIVAYTGATVDTLTVVPGLSDAGSAAVRFPVTAGTTYRIAVDSYTPPAASRGEFTLNLTQREPPANDNFDDATPLTGAEPSADGDVFAASMEPGERNHGVGGYQGGSIWYAWTAPSTGLVTLRTRGSGQTPGVGVYTGTSVTDLKPVGGNGYSSTWDVVSFRVLEGTTYHIAMQGTFYREPTGIHFSMSETTLPENDDFADATELPSEDAVSASGRNDGATVEPGEPAHWGVAYPEHSVWYAWTAPRSGSLTIDARSPSSGPVVAAYTGDTVSALTAVPGQSASCTCSYTQRLRIRVRAGTTYRIAVDSNDYSSPSGPGPFTLGLSLAATPSNDDLADAASIEPGSIVEGTNVSATQEVGEPGHESNSRDASVWYTWTAPATGGVTIDTTGSALNTVVAVYTGDSVGSLMWMSTSRGTGAFASKRRFRAVAGTTYRIVIDGVGGAQGTFRFVLDEVPPPANDMFDAAEPLEGSSARATGDNIGATSEPNEGNSVGVIAPTVWYSWTAPMTGAASVKLSGADYPASVGVFTGSTVGTLTRVPDGTRHFRAERGVTYRIAVYGYPYTSRGRFILRLSEKEAPPNDDLANAVELTGSDAPRSGTTVDATHESGEPSFSAGDSSVWYRWTAPVSGRATIDLSDVDYSSTVGVYTGSDVGRLAYVTQSWGTRAVFKATAGTTYRIAIDGQYGSEGRFGIALSEVETPPNDDYGSPAQMAGSADSARGTNVNASTEQGEPSIAGRAPSSSVWYRWRAPAAGRVTVDTAGSEIDTRLAVYTTSSGWSSSSIYSLFEVGSNDDADGTAQSRVTFDATAGTIYRFAVDSGGPAQGAIALHLRHASAPPNDAFADAAELVGQGPRAEGTNVGATREGGEPAHGGDPGGASVWYRWTAPADGTIDIGATPTGFVARFGVYRGDAVDALTSLGTRGVAVAAGETYRIAVDGANDGQGPREGTFTLALDFTPRPVAPVAPQQQVQSEPPAQGSAPPPGATGDSPAATDTQSSDSPASDSQPGEQPATEAPPAWQDPPADNTLAIEQPPAVDDSPASDPPPADDQPADDQPASDPPAAADPPAGDPPAEDPPANDPPAAADPPVGDDTPAGGNPPAGDSPPAHNPPTGDSPPANDPSASDTPPADDGPASDTPPADDGPASDAPPADDAPASDAPPADDPPAGDTPPAADPPASDPPAKPAAAQPRTKPAPTPRPAPLVASAKIAKQRLRQVLRSGLAVTVRCSAKCSVGGWLALDAATARRAGLRKRVVSTRPAGPNTGTEVRVVLRLTRAAVRKLARVRTAQLTVTLQARSGSGGARVARQVTLRR